MVDTDDKVITAEKAREFSFDEFTYYFDVAIAAGELSMPVENPEGSGINLKLDDGTVQEIRFTDRPMNRATLAVKKEMDDGKSYQSFIWRFWALMDLIREGKLGEWVIDDTENSGGQMIHPAVLDVARRMKLDKKGRFQTRNFLKLVEKSPVEID